MVIAVILARIGSKRIPRKNLRPLAGHPLITWTLEAARQSTVDRIVCSSDDDAIIDLAEEYGYGIRRPQEMATDEAPDAPAIRHALEAIQPSGYAPDDLVIHLRPTAPFRRPEEITKVAELLRRLPADSVVSVRTAREHPKKQFIETGETIGTLPELAPYSGASSLGESFMTLPTVWHAAGFIDAAKIGAFLRDGRMDCGVVMGWFAPEERALDLDVDEDWQRAEALALAKGWRPGGVA